MITFSNPEHGWIDLRIHDGAQTIEVCFSDVGPNSIMALQQALMALQAGRDHVAVPFFLEPASAELLISEGSDSGTIELEYAVDRRVQSHLLLGRRQFIGELSEALDSILPACTEPHWSQPTLPADQGAQPDAFGAG